MPVHAHLRQMLVFSLNVYFGFCFFFPAESGRHYLCGCVRIASWFSLGWMSRILTTATADAKMFAVLGRLTDLYVFWKTGLGSLFFLPCLLTLCLTCQYTEMDKIPNFVLSSDIAMDFVAKEPNHINIPDTWIWNRQRKYICFQFHSNLFSP